MDKFKIGDMVTVDDKHMPVVGTVVYIDEKRERYLVRFGGSQQMYYAEEQITLWKK
ncbi:hypothetical protein [Oceanobacillus sp. 1P07AA]|uniref:hypothetical protein n=1 Tax=Oceanobacillus sp. 1P07AA TaxID=3132293 RepID=UPI0039A7165B